MGVAGSAASEKVGRFHYLEKVLTQFLGRKQHGRTPFNHLEKLCSFMDRVE